MQTTARARARASGATRSSSCSSSSNSRMRASCIRDLPYSAEIELVRNLPYSVEIELVRSLPYFGGDGALWVRILPHSVGIEPTPADCLATAFGPQHCDHRVLSTAATVRTEEEHSHPCAWRIKQLALCWSVGISILSITSIICSILIIGIISILSASSSSSKQ